MIYADKAEAFARKMHEGQKDKGHNPYILHPQAVADGVEGDTEKAVAWLHDVLEDNKACNESSLRDAGFPDEIIEAVKLLTHDEKRHVPYQDYIEALSVNVIARHVKISDLKSNMDLSRMNGVDDGGIDRRMKKYHRAYDYLMEVEQR
jgi:(p)ppGpp synthase/HD superfamily hydrolase